MEPEKAKDKVVAVGEVTDTEMGKRLYDKLRPMFIMALPVMIVAAVFGISAGSYTAAKQTDGAITPMTCEEVWLIVQNIVNEIPFESSIDDDTIDMIRASLNLFGKDVVADALAAARLLLETDAPIPM